MTYYDLTPDQRRLASALHRGVELLVAGCLDVQRSVEDRLLDVRAGFALFATAVGNDLDHLVATGALSEAQAREARAVHRSAFERTELAVRDAIIAAHGAACSGALSLVLSEAASLVVGATATRGTRATAA